jgi:hypothetical protein
MQFDFKKFGWSELIAMFTMFALWILAAGVIHDFKSENQELEDLRKDNAVLTKRNEDYLSMLWGSDTHKALKALQQMEEDKKLGIGGN